MATHKKIKMTIKPDGSVEMVGDGFVGKECDAAMRPLEEALGIPSERENLDTYDEEVHEKQSVSDGGDNGGDAGSGWNAE